MLPNPMCCQAKEDHKRIHSQMITAGQESLDFTEYMCPVTVIHADSNSKSCSGL